MFFSQFSNYIIYVTIIYLYSSVFEFIQGQLGKSQLRKYQLRKGQLKQNITKFTNNNKNQTVEQCTKKCVLVSEFIRLYTYNPFNTTNSLFRSVNVTLLIEFSNSSLQYIFFFFHKKKHLADPRSVTNLLYSLVALQISIFQIVDLTRYKFS